MPFFMLAMYEKHGQPLEKIVGNILKVAVIRPKQRPYQTNNFYAVLKRQEMLDKEVYDIVHRNKKMAASDVDVYKRQPLKRLSLVDLPSANSIKCCSPPASLKN